MALQIGDKAPDFSGINQNGERLSLADFAGKKLALYFYPKDDTPGCTAQACNLTENYASLLEHGIAIVGVSPDSAESHQKFANKYGLNFQLLADTDRETIEKYGVWVEKNMYGHKKMGVARTTFLINEEGNIHGIISKVDTKDHARQISEGFGK